MLQMGNIGSPAQAEQKNRVSVSNVRRLRQTKLILWTDESVNVLSDKLVGLALINVLKVIGIPICLWLISFWCIIVMQ